MMQLSQVRGSCKHAIQDLKKWMAPEKVGPPPNPQKIHSIKQTTNSFVD
jgi:hypothetical protein